MQTAKVFENRGNQAVRLPACYLFEGDEVLVQRLGNALILVPKNAAWKTLMAGLQSFGEDIFEGGREPETPAVRDAL